MAEPLVDSGPEWGRTLLIVTGASRGFGAGVCEEFSKYLAKGSVIVGLARSEEGLETTKNNVHKESKNIQFWSAKVDLEECYAETFETILRDSVGHDDTGFETAILVHNAGSVGSVGGALNYLNNTQDLSAINKFYQLNVSSVIPVTYVFLKFVRGFSTKPKILLVNISSLCALSPTKSMALYCSAKAARDMLFKTLALEEGDAIRVLNYAPGPLDNDMQAELRTLTEDPELREMFSQLKKTNQLIPVKTSVGKLILILKENKFENGLHIDFYDC